MYVEVVDDVEAVEDDEKERVSALFSGVNGTFEVRL